MLKPEDIATIFEWIELLLIASLKRNLARHKDEEEQEGFTWSAWQAEKLRSINTFRRQSRVIMDRYKDQIDDKTRQLLEEQFEEGMNGAIQELEEAQPEKPAKQPEAQPQAEETTTAEPAPAEPAPVPTEPPTANEPPAEITVETTPEPVTPEPVIPEPVVKTEPQFFGVDRTKMDKLIEDVTNIEEQVETAALRMTDDVYRQTVNRIQLAMASGSIPYAKAVDMAVADFLAQGINCIEYKDGRRVNIADYVRMVLRTTSTRASLQGKSESFKAQGYDTVLVGAYGMCSKTCLPWQGRVYINDAFMDWSGDTRYEDGIKYGRSQYCGKWFPLLSSAIAEGLFHPNCKHGIGLYIDGVTDLPKPMDNSDIERRYKEEQHQRALEREVRKAKRRVEGFSDPEDVEQAKRERKKAEDELQEYIDKTNKAEGDLVFVHEQVQEKSYGAAELTDKEKADIIKEEKENRKRRAEIRRIREEVIPQMPTDTIVAQQDAHRVGTKKYEERKASLAAKKQYGPSYLTISDDEVLELVNQYKGTGEIKLGKRTGKWDNEETILTNDKVVGVVVNNLNGKTAKTTVFKIHYSEKGVHIVPDYPSKKKVKR